MGAESGNVPKFYSMDMSKDFIPMSVFSESSQGEHFLFGFHLEVSNAHLVNLL